MSKKKPRPGRDEDDDMPFWPDDDVRDERRGRKNDTFKNQQRERARNKRDFQEA